MSDFPAGLPPLAATLIEATGVLAIAAALLRSLLAALGRRPGPGWAGWSGPPWSAIAFTCAAALGLFAPSLLADAPLRPRLLWAGLAVFAGSALTYLTRLRRPLPAVGVTLYVFLLSLAGS
ncbi:hypothetical protein CFP65_0718 [Kitasatospora sp. MMS16-BH015]|uniref:hypothetical protein n=1 Tax=Kitasatospora sp. MMS16-BH015 TaxID=2018025 RepID=UPI000CA284EF|nr:hypothetical protein [Kitasatospora sp. MMS16-BH015]AUG75669.1 hypothetical protein CFP65_0718 [Kitasatospora sp. MMS16-BH015]